MLEGNILVTGGTGSLGTAILQRAQDEEWPARFTTFARNESNINRLKEKFPNVDCRVGDIQDIDFLRAVMPGHDIVLHFAAQKVVPLAESNVRNSIMTNVMGTLMVCQASVESGIKKVATTLTDKLVMATTVYGAGKFLAGALTREADTWGTTRFVNARYGNVVGSSNSLLPYLKSLKAQNKPFTITDRRCTRFWLTINQAIDVILLSLEQEERGITIVPKAPASPIMELFLAVDSNWKIEETGLRPGEKVHEMLIDPIESQHTVDKGDYFIIHPPDRKIDSNLPRDYTYTSDAPAKTLSRSELKEMFES